MTDDCGIGGLCNVNNYLYNSFIITSKERVRLKEIIYDNRPKEAKGKSFFSPMYLKEPRIKFVKQLIKKY